jgi:hypothetical protein
MSGSCSVVEEFKDQLAAGHQIVPLSGAPGVIGHCCGTIGTGFVDFRQQKEYARLLLFAAVSYRRQSQ